MRHWECGGGVEGDELNYSIYIKSAIVTNICMCGNSYQNLNLNLKVFDKTNLDMKQGDRIEHNKVLCRETLTKAMSTPLV